MEDSKAVDYKININELHAKKFADTWTYDKEVLKEYYVNIKLLYTPKGGKFKRGRYVKAYTQTEACIKAVDTIRLREGDKILEATAVCIDIVPVYYKRVITEKTAPNFGQVIANTKSPGKYKGMMKKDFERITRYNSCFTSEVVEFG
jgi:hypothetical protein